MNHMKLIPNIFIAVLMLLSAPAYTAQLGEYISLETENLKTFKVYVAGPMDASRGILLIHGWLGLNQDFEASDIEVSEISEMMGYADASAFTKAFKRWSNATPSRWREENRI